MAEITHFYQTFQPDHYDVFLDIDRDNKQIKGTTTVTGNATKTDIALNQRGLTVQSVKVADQDVPFTVDDAVDAIEIKLPNDGNVTISVEYSAKLTDTMMGIYPSYYEVDGQKKELVGTQFETTFARQAFPCVDEPEAKATFSLVIKYDEQPGETILSNMPENHVEDGYHYFDQTVKMSTYLVAFVFGDLQSKQTTTKSGVKVGVFGTKAHAAKELDFALDIAKRSIEFYEDFYQTKYPLPHSWQVALPDFSPGAMENWGLVTYREAYLLIDPDNTAFNVKERVATVIAHELAHQWFGDLVTMKWWDDLWLNESFANMMEYVAIDAIEPDWHIWEVFQTTDVPKALQRDATDGVQSVHVQVNDPSEIDALFDGAIVYAKGARMLVMVRALIGDDALRKGLKNYFAAHQYGNATGADLWKALGEASGMDVGAIMNSWLEQPGYPVVSASVEANSLILSQRQFYIGDGVDQGRLWQIPLNSNYQAAPQIFKDKIIEIQNYPQQHLASGEAFRVNVGNNSDFITRYDDTLLNDILDHLDALDPIDQLQILQDLRLLAEGNVISYASVVPLLQRFADSHSSIVNDALYQVANSLKNFVQPDSDDEKNLRALFDQLSAGQVARLGWESSANESNDDQLTRPHVLRAALFAKNQGAIDQAHDLFQANQANLAGLSAGIRVLVLSNEVKNFGSLDLFHKLIKEYTTTSDASYKNDLAAAITTSPDKAVLAEIVDEYENASVIKPQDLRAWFSGVLNNPVGEQLAWDWIRNDWQWLEDTVGGDMEFATFITVIANAFHTKERLAEFKEFFAPKLAVAGLTREIKMDTKVIAGKVNLIHKEQTAVNQAVAEALDNKH